MIVKITIYTRIHCEVVNKPNNSGFISRKAIFKRGKSLKNKKNKIKKLRKRQFYDWRLYDKGTQLESYLGSNKLKP